MKKLLTTKMSEMTLWQTLLLRIILGLTGLGIMFGELRLLDMIYKDKDEKEETK